MLGTGASRHYYTGRIAPREPPFPRRKSTGWRRRQGPIVTGFAAGQKTARREQPDERHDQRHAGDSQTEPPKRRRESQTDVEGPRIEGNCLDKVIPLIDRNGCAGALGLPSGIVHLVQDKPSATRPATDNRFINRWVLDRSHLSGSRRWTYIWFHLNQDFTSRVPVRIAKGGQYLLHRGDPGFGHDKGGGQLASVSVKAEDRRIGLRRLEFRPIQLYVLAAYDVTYVHQIVARHGPAAQVCKVVIVSPQQQWINRAAGGGVDALDEREIWGPHPAHVRESINSELTGLLAQEFDNLRMLVAGENITFSRIEPDAGAHEIDRQQCDREQRQGRPKTGIATPRIHNGDGCRGEDRRDDEAVKSGSNSIKNHRVAALACQQRKVECRQRHCGCDTHQRKKAPQQSVDADTIAHSQQLP